MSFDLSDRDVLVVVDIQYDFLPGGSLAVGGGDEIIPLVNALGARFRHVVLTQDWHPADHISFASNHPGRAPFETVELGYGTQVLWPNHCVWGTAGAAHSAELDLPGAELVIRKGYNRGVDSYSGFREADRRTRTGLSGYLRERGFERLFVVGLATDFCVAWTALDGQEEGFPTAVIEDATRAIDAGGSLGRAWRDMNAAGVTRLQAADLTF